MNQSCPTPRVNVATRLKRMARIIPYKKAVIFPAARVSPGRVAYTHLTFRQLDRTSDQVAAGLQSMGIRQGTRTVLMVKPSLDFFVLIFALFKTGAVPVVVDPGMGLRRMVTCLQECSPDAFIGIPAAHILRLLFPARFKSVRIHVTVGRKLLWGGCRYESLLDTPVDDFHMAPTRSDETAAILFTTGSTGPAKGVVYTHGNFEAQLNQIKSHLAITTDEVDLSTFPLFALFWPALGVTAVIPDMDPTRPALVNPRRIIEAIRNHGITNMFASPALLNRVGAYGKKHGIKLPSLRRVFSAGAPVSPENIAQFATLLCDEAEIQTPYGATEAVPIISIGSHEILSETRPLSEKGYGMCIGRPINRMEIRIITISDNPIPEWCDDLQVPDGEVGEIVVRGDLVTQRYFNRPEADAIAKIRDKETFWHRMGDLAWRDPKGRYWFCGRKSHRVTTTGGTLYTIPCEAIFNPHEQVFRSALVGVGPAGNQLPVICIERHRDPAPGALSPGELTDELLAMAAGNDLTKTIRHILFHRAFPVDIRHNSKIFREKLAVWAGCQPTVRAILKERGESSE